MLVDSLGVDTRESLEKDTFRMCYEYTYILTVIIVPIRVRVIKDISTTLSALHYSYFIIPT